MPLPATDDDDEPKKEEAGVVFNVITAEADFDFDEAKLIVNAEAEDADDVDDTDFEEYRPLGTMTLAEYPFPPPCSFKPASSFPCAKASSSSSTYPTSFSRSSYVSSLLE